MTHNRGSFLIICMSLMVLMVILALAALHEIRLQVQTSTGNERYLLAQAAARAGLNHAVEDILADYNQTTITLRSSSSSNGVTLPSVTYLDGQYRAPFVAIYSPNNTGTDYTPGHVDDDVRSEDNVLEPMAWWWFENNSWWNTSMYDGKGRYYEPNYYNATFNTITATAPVAPTMFADPNALLPERAEPMLYDEQFCRIPSSGNVQQDRKAARYRLRYSVGVEDLSGHLLINPMPDMQMLATDGGGNPLTVDYRHPEVRYPWMPAAADAAAVIFALSGTVNNTYAVQGPSGSCSPELGTQFQNVYEGRGWQTNVDMDHSATGITGTPITFPLMYRNHSTQLGGGGPGNWGSYIDSAGTNSLTTNLYWSDIGAPLGLAGGGEPIPNWSWNDGSNFWPYGSNVINHCLMGPQLSFDNVTYAVAGNRAYLAGQDSGLPCGWTKFAVTPFGRALTTSGYIPYGANNKWYMGRVNTPTYLNFMTAPPEVLAASLLAYLQPRVKAFPETLVTFYFKTGQDVNGNPTYAAVNRDNPPGPPPPAPGPSPLDPSQLTNQLAYYGRDFMVDTTCPPCFSQWTAPTRVDQVNPPAQPLQNVNPPTATGIGQVIKPDYYGIDDRPYLVQYPGPFMNGDPTLPHQAGDDFELLMDAHTLLTNSGSWGAQAYGLDIHDRQFFMLKCIPIPQPKIESSWNETADPANILPGPPLSAIQKDRNDTIRWCGYTAIQAQTEVPSTWGWNPTDMALKTVGTSYTTYSYFYEMIDAMATALSVFRANYVQYDTTFTSSTLFPPGMRSPEKFQTLRDLDRQFLAQLGESLDAPGSGAPSSLVASHVITPFRINGLGSNPQFSNNYIPINNIQSMVSADALKNVDGTVSSVQRAHALELILNDFRMSFLGSSPAYSDTSNLALEFRPLDFVGDGRAYCSCYTTLDADNLPYAPVGTKPPNYFSLTGSWFIGKSHFYRVFSRGEIWDNLLNIKVNDATLDSVLTVDPEGTNPNQTQFLYQRWFYSRYLAMLPRIQR